MKKWISLMAALLMAVTSICALAEDSADLRHEVTGDVSTLDVVEEAGLSQGEVNEEGTGATLGTEVYLIVDPDTASYVTFYVTDEQGYPISGAAIYITYNGVTELYGVTDENGQCSMYLFRNVEYGYRVEKSGYETVRGRFTAAQETREIRVVLRKLHTLTVVVVDGDTLQPGVTVRINGKSYVTDDEGRVQVRLPNGVYSVTVVTPDGRQIPVRAVVDGDTVIVVDIAAGDGFLVYNKLYAPEDYVLTKYAYAQEDISRADDEDDAAFAQRVERYLAAYPSVILVEAQPERTQLASGDRDVLNSDGTPRYAQRSMMPMGSLLRAWEEEGFTQLVFTNEDMGIALMLRDLHSANMTRLFALVEALNSGAADPWRAVTDEAQQAQNDKPDLDWDEIDVLAIDFDAMRPYTFDFDQQTAGAESLDGSVFTNTLFEFRITPILPDALLDMVVDGFGEEPAMERDSIMLANHDYYLEQLRQWQADGKLTDDECDELFHYVTDGQLSEQEISELCLRAEEGTLTAKMVEWLVQAAVDGNMYRASCWIICDDVQVDITALLNGMRVVWNADEQYAATYEEQLRLLAEQEAAGAVEELAETHMRQLDESTRAALQQRYQQGVVDSRSLLFDGEDSVPGVASGRSAVTAVRALPLPQDEFHAIVSRKVFERLTVDVRRETLTSDTQVKRCLANVTAGTATLREACRLVADSCVSGLYWLDAAE